MGVRVGLSPLHVPQNRHNSDRAVMDRHTPNHGPRRYVGAAGKIIE